MVLTTLYTKISLRINELNIIVGVAADYYEKAVHAIYEAFVGKE